MGFNINNYKTMLKNDDKNDYEETKRTHNKSAETIIGPSVKVKGNFNSNGDIIVDGFLEGSLKTNSNVLIGAKAKIQASLEANDAIIGGEVNGNIKIKEHLSVIASARIFGDIECSTISVEKGAIINGHFKVGNPEKKVDFKEENKKIKL